MECGLPFGGKVMVFGGDFRQVIPVVTRGTRAQVTDATLQRSYLWEKIRKIRLSRNMRAQYDPWLSNYLLLIGNGTEETIGDDYIRLPDDIVIGFTNTEALLGSSPVMTPILGCNMVILVAIWINCIYVWRRTT